MPEGVPYSRPEPMSWEREENLKMLVMLCKEVEIQVRGSGHAWRVHSEAIVDASKMFTLEGTLESHFHEPQIGKGGSCRGEPLRQHPLRYVGIGKVGGLHGIEGIQGYDTCQECLWEGVRDSELGATDDRSAG